MEQRFEVADAAIRRDKAFIPNVSCVWSGGTSIFKVANEHLAGLQKSREISDEEIEHIQNAIMKLQSLLTFPFTALELAADISEENVSDVFVRINSKGTPLNQADFILTLMSVFWDEGRADLEHFCRDARKPTKRSSSPFNYFIEPNPDQLLRVGVGVAFKRARLKYVYSILRGKDLETEKFSDERRVTQFDRLKNAQARTLNVQHWHDFMNCIRIAGFRSGKMISSNNNLLFSYMLYLIGRTEYGVEEFTLRKVIAQWFFMSAVTGRFTGSPESAMEFDLARLRDAVEAEQFVSRLQHVCDITLTNDFWEVTLPNDLATSSPRSPSLFAYNASLVLLNAPVLFSNTKVTERFNDSELAGMYHYHALPNNWEHLEYSEFLEKRREMIAQIIREGYETLTVGPESKTASEEFDLLTVIGGGESEAVEFKSTLRINLHTNEPDKRMELAVLKTLAGLLNTDGGTLIVGVSDDGTPVGVEADKFPNEDKMSLHLVNIVKDRMGPQAMTAMHVHFDDYEDSRVMVIRCTRSPAPAFVKDGDIERFYVRTGPSTTELPASQTQTYIKSRFRQ